MRSEDDVGSERRRARRVDAVVFGELRADVLRDQRGRSPRGVGPKTGVPRKDAGGCAKSDALAVASTDLAANGLRFSRADRDAKKYSSRENDEAVRVRQPRVRPTQKTAHRRHSRG